MESAGFVTELMTEIRAQIQALISTQLAALEHSESEVVSLLS